MDDGSERVNSAETNLPLPGQTVIVQCPGFQCLAYRDGDGKWFDAVHHEPLSHVLQVISAVLG